MRYKEKRQQKQGGSNKMITLVLIVAFSLISLALVVDTLFYTEQEE